MKKTLLTAALALTTILTSSAQDLEFDNSFNNGNPYQDNYVGIGITPSFSYSNYGRMKQLNDSVFVYYINTANWNNNTFRTDVRAIISHSNGTVEHTEFGINAGSFQQAGDPDVYFITDIITNATNGHVYVVRNSLYNDAGTDRRCVLVHGYQYESNGPSFPAIPNWGIDGTGIAQISLPGTNVYGAKGTILSGGPYLAINVFSVSNQNIAISSVISNGQGAATTIITSNGPSLYSQVADIVAVSNSEVYIADNAATNSSGVINDNARILKWIPTSNVLDPNYGGGDGIADISWNSQSNTPFVQDQIKRIYYIDNGGTDYGKLLVTGTSREDISAQYTPVHGKVTRLNNNGTLDNAFGVNGTFAPDFSADRFRTYFNDIDIEMDVLGGTEGSYYISGSGSVGDSPNHPNESFLLAIDVNGQIETGKGNNGFLFENANYSEIVETIIIPGNTVLEDQFVFNGMKIINPDPQMYEQETAIGRLVWGNGAAGVNEVTAQTILSLYPNPANTVLNIKLSEATQIRIVNLLGETIATQKLNEGNNSIDVCNLVSGVYFLQTENGSATRFIKQ